MIYLDWAATAPPNTGALAEALEASESNFGNPSSGHEEGRKARRELEAARASLLASLFLRTGSKPLGSLIFTGSGTEADQIPLLALLAKALRAGLSRDPRPQILVSSIEHAAVHAQAELLGRLGFDLGFVPPEPDGRVEPGAILARLKPQTRFLALMAVNNETGAVQDIGAAAAALESLGASRRKALHFHVDCVQALGKIPLGFLVRGVDSAAFSAHKLGGPKGVGALWTRRTFEALGSGGGQEEGMRSGTENLFGAAAFARCAEAAVSRLEENRAKAAALESRLAAGALAIPGVRLVPETRKPGDGRWVPSILSLAFPGLGGEVVVRALSDRGIAVSTGSACSHAKPGQGRRVLEAMGLEAELAFSAIRVSIGPATTPEEIDAFLEAAEDLYARLRA